MIEWCEKSAARMILGQTMTSGADGKSSTNTLGQAHNQVRHDLMISDTKSVAQTIGHQILLPYLSINLPSVNRRRCPAFECDTREKLAIPDIQESDALLSVVVKPGVIASLSANHGRISAQPRTASLST